MARVLDTRLTTCGTTPRLLELTTLSRRGSATALAQRIRRSILNQATGSPSATTRSLRCADGSPGETPTRCLYNSSWASLPPTPWPKPSAAA